MNFQVPEEEYLALLNLKSTVEVVLKVWETSKDFATRDSVDVFFITLAKEVAKIPPRKDTGATEEFL